MVYNSLRRRTDILESKIAQIEKFHQERKLLKRDEIKTIIELSDAQTTFVEKSFYRYNEKITEYFYLLQKFIFIKSDNGEIYNPKTMHVDLMKYREGAHSYDVDEK